MSRILISVLDWRVDPEVMKDTLSACRLEQQRMRAEGHEVEAVVLDNDGNSVRERRCRAFGFNYYSPSTNRGPSLRNWGIDIAQRDGFTHLLLLDSDIEPIPGSLHYLHSNLSLYPDLYCLGPQSFSCSPNRLHCTQYLPPNLPLEGEKGWMGCSLTQYGLWRTDLIGTCRFPEWGPGWGWEDNWMHLLMLELGFSSCALFGLTYLHRDLNSSWHQLESSGISVVEEWERRMDLLTGRFIDSPSGEVRSWASHWSGSKEKEKQLLQRRLNARLAGQLSA